MNNACRRVSQGDRLDIVDYLFQRIQIFFDIGGAILDIEFGTRVDLECRKRRRYSYRRRTGVLLVITGNSRGALNVHHHSLNRMHRTLLEPNIPIKQFLFDEVDRPLMKIAAHGG